VRGKKERIKRTSYWFFLPTFLFLSPLYFLFIFSSLVARSKAEIKENGLKTPICIDLVGKASGGGSAKF